jgi:hypothetical protein
MCRPGFKLLDFLSHGNCFFVVDRYNRHHYETRPFNKFFSPARPGQGFLTGKRCFAEQAIAALITQVPGIKFGCPAIQPSFGMLE